MLNRLFGTVAPNIDEKQKAEEFQSIKSRVDEAFILNECNSIDLPVSSIRRILCGYNLNDEKNTTKTTMMNVNSIVEEAFILNGSFKEDEKLKRTSSDDSIVLPESSIKRIKCGCNIQDVNISLRFFFKLVYLSFSIKGKEFSFNSM